MVSPERHAVDAFARLAQAPSWAEAAEVVEQEPSLLDADSLSRIDEAVHAGPYDDFNLAIVDDLLDRLRACRAFGTLDPLRRSSALPWSVVADRFLGDFRSAQEHYDSFSREAQPAEISAAVAGWARIQDDLDFPSTPSSFQRSVLDGLAASLLMRHYAFQDSEDLDRGVAYGQQVLRLTPADDRLRIRRLTNLSGALAARFNLRHERADLDAAIDYAREAVQNTPPSAAELPGRVNNLAAALSLRHDVTHRVEDLDESIRLHRRAVSTAPSDQAARARLLFNLGMALRRRNDDDKNAATLDDAIGALADAVSFASPGMPERGLYCAELGRTYLRRHAERGAADDLDQAIIHLRGALDLAPPAGAERADRATGLGFALRERFASAQQIADLDDALDAFSDAAAALPPNAPVAPQYLANILATVDQATQRETHILQGGPPPEERARAEFRRGVLELRRNDVTGDDSHLDDAIVDLRRAIDATPPTSSEYEERRFGLANALRRRALERAAVSDLDEAVSLLEALRERPLEGGVRLRLEVDLGTLLAERSAIRPDTSDTDFKRAIELLDSAWQRPADTGERAQVATNLTAVLLRHFDSTGDRSSLERTISVGQRALEEHSSFTPELASQTAEALLRRWNIDSNPDDIEQAIEICWAAIGDDTSDSPRFAACFNSLGGALRARFARTADIADLGQAIQAYQRALALAPGAPTYLSNVGAALRARFSLREQVEDLDAALEYLRTAVDRSQPNSISLAVHLSNLASGFLTRYEHTQPGAVEDLDAAIDAQRRARALLSVGSAQWAGTAYTLGQVLLTRYERTHVETDYQDAVQVLEEGAAASPPPAIVPLLSLKLAAARRMRLAPDPAEADLERVRNYYRHACETGLQDRLEACAASASDWGSWALERRAWPEAVEAYAFGLTAIERGVHVQLGRANTEAWLQQIQKIPAAAAYAFARVERMTEAVMAIETGRARLLSDALQLDRRDLERLPGLGYTDVYRRYRNAVTRLAGGATASDNPAASLDAVQHTRTSTENARHALDTLVQEIRAIPGYSDFLAPPNYEQVAEAARTAPLVYVLSTVCGGLALIVSASDGAGTEAIPVWLDNLTVEALGSHVGAYLDAYLRDQRSEDRSATMDAWFEALDTATGWLGETVLRPLSTALGAPLSAPVAANGEPREVVLVPAGPLAILPFAAAWVSAPGEGHGRYYAIDTLRLRYAPNARALVAARQVAMTAAAERLLLVSEPQPVRAAALPYARAEAAAVAACWSAGSVTPLAGAEATRSAVKDALDDYTVLHFAGHAFALMLRPQESGLLLAADEVLTVRDLAEQRLSLRLAILSACETGVPGVALFDELVGLPTGLVQAGTAGVIASLWTAADDSTAMLMGTFHRLWRSEQLDPVEALRRAQIQLRARGYDHPFYWGLFSYTGA